MGLKVFGGSSHPTLTLQFNQPVAPADVAARCLIEDVEKGEPTALRAAGEVADTIAVTLDKPLAQGRRYALVCKGIAGAGGNVPLADTYRFALRTYPGLR